MTPEEVRALLGAPLKEYALSNCDEGCGLTPADKGWRYSMSPSEEHYRVRVVLFRHGQVVEKLSQFWVD
jgi:hypothetical protein